MGENRYSCLVCKKEADKTRRKGYMPSILAWFFWDTEEQIIAHIKKDHPKEYEKTHSLPQENNNG